MIPVRDVRPRLHLPVLTFGLIALLALVAAGQLLRGQGAWVAQLAFSPARLSAALRGEASLSQALLAVPVSVALHLSWVQLAGDLLYLYVFGDHLEDRFGGLRYALFLVGAVLASAGAQYVFAPDPAAVVVGASGVIAALLGAYLSLWPRQRILSLFPVLFFLTLLEVPAGLFVPIFGLQHLAYMYLPIDGLGYTLPWPSLLGGLGYGLGVGLSIRLLTGTRARPPRPRLSSLPGRPTPLPDED